MNQPIAKIIDNSDISRFQLLAITICVALNALDGFDVLAISFASPGIAAEWGITKAELGVVLAMELIGMAIGSIVLGGSADKYGRKPTIQFCLLLMTFGMLAAAMVSSIPQLLIVRFITGLGIGGMLASTNAMVAEFANAKYRNLCVIIMATGYPIGAVLGGTVASELLTTYSWRAVFFFGGSVTGVFILIVWLLLPESVIYLASSGATNKLEKINKTLRKMGKPVVDVITDKAVMRRKFRFAELFSPNLKRLTILLLIAYFAQIMTFYFILKWIPKIVVDMGFPASEAGQVLVYANLGGGTGAILLGLVASKFDLRKVLLPVLVMGFVMVTVFGIGYDSLTQIAMISAATGFFTNAGVVGLYGLMAKVFPPEVRASGTGVVIGFGRGGAALSPILAGILFSGGMSLLAVAAVMGAGALIAAIAVYLLGRPAREHISAAPDEITN